MKNIIGINLCCKQYFLPVIIGNRVFWISKKCAAKGNSQLLCETWSFSCMFVMYYINQCPQTYCWSFSDVFDFGSTLS